MRLLVVEDEVRIAEILRQSLGKAGFVVDAVASCVDARAALEVGAYDAVILDLGLPDGDGLTLLGDVRSRGSQTPTLVLTARDAIEDRVSGLDAGADDYLVKPFALAELEARVRALIRRSHGRDRNLLVHGPLTFDTAARAASVAGEALDLSARELAILELLLLRSGRVIGKEQFVDHLYGFNEEVSENAIEVYVHRLRRKLDPVGIHVQTVRGLGYFLAKA